MLEELFGKIIQTVRLFEYPHEFQLRLGLVTIGALISGEWQIPPTWVFTYNVEDNTTNKGTEEKELKGAVVVWWRQRAVGA